MDDTAFRLGKLLAAMDMVHLGYCVDIRGGQIPPSLLGNQIFGMAQRNPVAALKVLGQRLKPYLAWHTRAQYHFARYKTMSESNKPEDKQKGISILTALRHGREVRGEAEALIGKMGNSEVNDLFHAEMLLGYMAGFPKAPEPDPLTPDNTDQTNSEE